MESITSKSRFEMSSTPKIVSIAKPPWTGKTKNHLQRVIVQLGYGFRGTGWMRSLPCIGHVKIIPRGKKMGIKELESVFRDLKNAGVEVWLTNHDSLEDLENALKIAEFIDLRKLSVVLLKEDLEKVNPRSWVKYYVELRYPFEKLDDVASYPWLTGAVVVMEVEDFDVFMRVGTTFKGDVYVDLIPPKDVLNAVIYGKYKLLDAERGEFHPCLAGTLGVTPEGYVLPCPAMGNYVVGHVREGVLKVARKRKVRNLWRLKGEDVEECSTCPLRNRCHDCRALNYNLTLDERGLGFCPIGR